MNDPKDTSRILDAVAADFIPEDVNLLPDVTVRFERKTLMQSLRARPALMILFVLLALALFTGAAYAVGRSLGYIPGVGLVDQSAPIRVLADPVSVTRDGVTVAVTEAIITSDKTSLVYRVLGVPHAAYPEGEAVTGCISGEYLRLPDGTKMDVVSNMPSLPADMDTATFVLPCIFNTLPGTVPENWELPLRFVPAPPDMTILPVTEILPSSTLSPQADTPVAAENPLVITRVLEIGSSYIIMGELRYDVTHDPALPAGSWWLDGGVTLTDANGQSVPYSYPNDIDLPTLAPSENWMTWVAQVEEGFAPPLTISYQGQAISPSGAKEQAEFQFDAGPAPQSGAHWSINQDFTLGGYNIRLVSIDYDTRAGYNFNFRADPGASSNLISVDILGYTPNCGGGGGGEEAAQEFSRNVCVADPATGPKGLIQAILSFQALSRQDKAFAAQWAPEGQQGGSSAASTPEVGVCVTSALLPSLAPAPADLTGKVLLHQQLPDGQNLGIFLSNLDGSQSQVVGAQASWPTFLPDGSHVSYLGQDALHILDLDTGSDVTAPGVATGGYNLQWSPDGQQVAFMAGANDVFVSAADGTHLRQLTDNADYKTLAGWSPDGKQLYITVPGLNGWVLRVIELETGATQDLFTLNDASVKAPNVTLSPDGQWIAYRNTDLSSLYVVRLDGTQGHKVVDRASEGISSGFWSAGGDWLAASLLNTSSNEQTVILVQPDTCQAYLLPGLHGILEGLRLP